MNNPERGTEARYRFSANHLHRHQQHHDCLACAEAASQRASHRIDLQRDQLHRRRHLMQSQADFQSQLQCLQLRHLLVQVDQGYHLKQRLLG